jgi:myo-inositol-1(or 4)-monophosphatase
VDLPEVPDVRELADLAASAARRAGALLLDGLSTARTSVETKSSATDMVSEMDRAAEGVIREELLGARPDDAVLGEEGGAATGTSGVRWIVDPLDGTTNYLYGFPAWSVSVAAEVDGVVQTGVVYDAQRDEMFRAEKGSGATCNGQVLAVHGAPELATALVATGFGYAAERRTIQAAWVAHVLPRVRDIRRAGSAALDLCWVAAGRVDAYYEQGTHIWDYAAGALIAAEAGAWVGGFDDGPPSTDGLVAAAPQLAEPLRRLLAAARQTRPGSA